MPAPDQGLVERQYYLSVLGWASDVPSLSLEDLRQRVLEAKTIKALDRNIRYEDPTQPLPSTLQSAGFGGSVTATDNGDGGVTLATSPSTKFPKYSYVEATFLKLVNAAALSTTTPAKETAAGSPGTAATAARGDHQHPSSRPSYPVISPQPSGYNCYTYPIGQIDSFSLDNTKKCPMTPLPVPRAFTLKNLIFRNQGGDGSAVYSIAIYAVNLQGRPTGAPIYSSAFAAATGTGNVTHSLGAGVDLTNNLYFIAYGAKGFTSTRPAPCSTSGYQHYAGQFIPVYGGPGQVEGLFLGAYNETTGAWPTITQDSDFTVGTNTNSIWRYGIDGTLL